MKRITLCILSALLSASALAAEPIGESSSRPLIQVRGFHRIAHAGPADTLTYLGFVILGGGSVNSVAVACDLRAGCFWGSQVAQGVASLEAMQELIRRLVEGRIGFERGGCHFVDFGPVEYEYEITWFGRGARTNTFTVAHTFPAECPHSLRLIIGAIFDAESSIYANPATKVWRSHS
ncbi:MAG TPA: hypothetical protein VF121_16285 [Thermoanaerobaculia bacterium]|nr:hypothetical protein [Thermoanaerobaculia bacterium]